MMDKTQYPRSVTSASREPPLPRRKLVADGAGAPAVLDDLAARYPRLVQADGDDRWRLHDELREFLAASLAREDRGAVASLHARAATHFEGLDGWRRAAEHHVGAEAWDDLVRVLERHGDALIERESPAWLLARLDALPPGTRRARCACGRRPTRCREFQLDSCQAAHFGTGEQGFSHAQGRRFMLAKLVVSVVAIAVSLPWWRAIGLIR